MKILVNEKTKYQKGSITTIVIEGLHRLSIYLDSDDPDIDNQEIGKILLNENFIEDIHLIRSMGLGLTETIDALGVIVATLFEGTGFTPIEVAILEGDLWIVF